MGSQDIDLRVHAIRDDIADKSLAGYVSGQRLVEARAAVITGEVVAVRSRPQHDAPLDTQALFGEAVYVFDEAGGWSWVQLQRDGYVGYILSDNISYDQSEPDHFVKTLSTFVYPEPNIKVPPTAVLPMNAAVEVTNRSDKFIEVSGGGFIYSAHVSGIQGRPEDFVSVAEMYIGTPYLWGGRSSRGIDCSGLVQMSLMATGRDIPRDSDMQEKQTGRLIGNDISNSRLVRGDLLFWKGHVGIMVNPDMLLHANGYHMLTVVEPVTEAVQRIADMYGSVTSIKRL
ncbi:MAG: NlpC/P60 family protein [Methyloligellaceae bacterium]